MSRLEATERQTQAARARSGGGRSSRIERRMSWDIEAEEKLKFTGEMTVDGDGV